MGRGARSPGQLVSTAIQPAQGTRYVFFAPASVGLHKELLVGEFSAPSHREHLDLGTRVTWIDRAQSIRLSSCGAHKTFLKEYRDILHLGFKGSIAGRVFICVGVAHQKAQMIIDADWLRDYSAIEKTKHCRTISFALTLTSYLGSESSEGDKLLK